jgi:hypothetical protein
VSITEVKHTTGIFTVMFVFMLCSLSAQAELPPDLPGDEITHEYLNSVVPKDTAKKVTEKKPSGTGLPWLDKTQKSWDAPPLAEQMAAEEAAIPIGKGGVFVPRFTGATSEPDVNILDSSGRTVASGNTGHIFSLEPGSYRVILGSGAHNQRMVRPVTVEEGKTVPIIPDWAGLTVETIDSMATPFRGEYELVRIDEFETYGRGLGANPELGEVVKTWILNPGVYKILGVGQGYNSLINFITVRVLPGELCKLLLVQDSTTFRILGGGTVDVTPPSKITSHWKYGANIGGNISFNSEIDRHAKDTTINTLFGLLSTLWLTYQHQPYEWQTRIRLNEGFNFSGINVGNLLMNADDFLLTSLFIWRFLSWLGPYGSAQIHTTFLPRRFIRGDKTSFFCLLDENYHIANPSTPFDSSRSFNLQPSFSPLLLDIGFGVNADALKFSFLETKLRVGFGTHYSYLPRYYQIVDSSSVQWQTVPDTTSLAKLSRSVVLHPQNATSDFGFGPQASISGMVRIGRFITADGDLKIFAPIAPTQRLLRPDFDLLADISWRLSNLITLDYTYTFLLQQPENVAAQLNKSTHGVWLRFSYSSR